MKTIRDATAGQGGIAHVNRVVAGAIISGMVAVQGGVAAVDNFVCGETEALEMLPLDKVEATVFAACAAGQVGVLQELLLLSDGGGGGGGSGGASLPARAAEARRVVVEDYYPLFTAASNGREGIVEVLLGMEGVDVNRGNKNGATPL